MQFVDEVQLKVSSGKGGPGCVSFRRESHVPRGGPDGGDGGRGGHVIVKADPRLSSLLDLRYKRHHSAGHGEAGRGRLQSGADGQDLIIRVPAGTMVKDDKGHLLADIGLEGEFLLLQGGRGGKGNAFFKTSVNQAPTHAQTGEEGQAKDVLLELKLLADVGIIGFPNVGKSTLISHISAARPKVADYPFTTLVPNLGVVRFGEEQSFVVADIPGLVPGAHEGVGLGDRFLRHIERTGVFIHVVDVSEMSQRDPWEDYEAINKELQLYDQDHQKEEGFSPLSSHSQIIALNKVDTLPPDRLAEWMKKFSQTGRKVIPISAVTGQNLQEMVYQVGLEVFKSKEGELV